MRTFFILLRRQCAAFFISPVAYVALVPFLAVFGVSFCRLLAQSLEESLRTGDILFGSLYFWLMIPATVTLLTMPLFAEERRNGTLETLLTAPVSDIEVTLAKYTGACICFGCLCLPTLAAGAFMYHCHAGPEPMDLIPVATGYAGLLLLAAFFIAVGLFVSALTRSQVTAGLLTFPILCALFFVEPIRYVFLPERLRTTVEMLSGTQHILDFSQGIVDTRPLVLYVSLAAFFLFATVKVIESRHWR